MERKENDLFMTMLASPQANFNDLVVGGLNVDNTSLQDREIYKNNDKVRQAYQNEDGTFNDDAFNSAYNYVLSTYNNLSSASVDKALEDQLTFHRSNPFAPVEKRRQGPEFQEYKMANPYEQVFNMVELGRVEAPTKSIDELAQSHSVLLNPTTAGDNLENAQWGDSPNGNLGKYFWDTLVLAQYDEDGQHYDPFTGQMVNHNKGDLKLNNDGEFYYEKLDGRGVVGKKVLNKMNILTTDGSNLNRYDFFDSDDLTPKSFGGNLMKNLALVGSMFLPGVGPWITGLSVATQAAGFLSALGNMATATQGGVLSEIEGFAKSWDRGTLKTEYAQQNPWCVESFIDMIAEFLAFTREQRIIFEKVPQLIKGQSIATKAQQDAKYAELKNLTDKANQARFDMAMKDPTFANNIEKVAKAKWELNQISAFQAQAQLESFIKGYQNLGELLSRAYLVGNGAANTYEEALNQGADEIDATILTLGHAAAEYAFLSTGIGKWLFPELRQDTYRNQAIAKALTTAKKEGQAQSQSVWKALKSFDKENKKAYFTNLFNLGKGIATAEYSNGQKTLITTLATSAGGAVEMLGFDVLRDISNSCYNLVKWLNGDEHRMSAFAYNAETGEYDRAGLVSRYGLSFLTGWIGGAASNFVHNFNMIKDLEKMTSKQAMEQVIYMIRNGQADRFIKDINKMTLADPHLSATESEFINGEEVFKPGTETDNQDLAVKNAIKTNIDIIRDILEAEGANLSDDSFLDRQTLSDLRFVALKDTLTADAFLNEFNDLSSELAEFTFKINKVYESALDTNNDGAISDPESRRGRTKEEIKKLLSDEQRKELDRLESQRSEVRKQLKGLIDGERSMEFVQKALFEASKALSGELTEITFNDYIRNHYGRSYDVLSEVEKKDAVTKYAEWLKTAGREKVGTISDVFYSYDVNTSDVIKNHGKRMLEQSELTRGIDEMIAKTYDLLNPEYWNDNDAWLQFISNTEDPRSAAKINQRLRDYISRQLLSEEEKNELNVINGQIFDVRNRLAEENIRLYEAQKLENNELQEEIKDNISNLKQQAVNLSNNYEERNVGALRNHFNTLYEALANRGYANEETKENLTSVLNKIAEVVRHQLDNEQTGIEMGFNTDTARFDLLQDYYNEIVGKDVEAEETDENGNKITIHQDGLIDKINKLDDSPFFKNINEFANAIGKDGISLNQLERDLNKAYRDNIDDLSKFAIDPSLDDALKNALTTIKIYRAAIMAARTDNAGWNDYFGYNATLNEISKKRDGKQPQLAEIDSISADQLVTDIDIVYNKLKYLSAINEINKGQKISQHDRVATVISTRKYQAMKRFLNIPNNSPLRNWNGFDEFVNTIRACSYHEELLNSKKTNLSTEERKQLETEKLQFEDGIYDFISANEDKLKDPNRAKELINTDIFNLYTLGTGLLNEETEALDDNAFMYYLCSRGAVKSSAFYRSFAEELKPDEEKPIIPIPVQEEHIYLAFSKIMNSPLFDLFYNTARKSMYDSWQGFDEEKKAQILQQLNVNKNLAGADFNTMCGQFLPLPQYASTVYIEGIAGAGKSLGCGPLILRLIAKHAPNLLKNVVVINGVDKEDAIKAKNLAANLDLENAKCYSTLEFLKRITGNNYSAPEKNGDGVYEIDGNSYGEVNNDGFVEYGSKTGVINDENAPKLIIIDELTRIDDQQFSTIDRYARAHGTTVIAFGDDEQLGVRGRVEIQNDQQKEKLNEIGINGYDQRLLRHKFIRFQKLGVSMRTQNALMTQAQNTLIAAIHSNQKKVNFDYYKGDENSKTPGLHGVRTIGYRDSEGIQPYLRGILNDARFLLNDAKARGINKIGFIGDESSEIYKALIDELGSDSIDAFFGGREQGDEGLYFIIDADVPTTNTKEEYLSKLYTGITRAQQGAILIEQKDNGIFNTKSRLVESNIPESALTPILRKYTENRKKLLLEITKEGSGIEYKKPEIVKNKIKAVANKADVSDPENDEEPDGKSDITHVDIEEKKDIQQPDKPLYLNYDNNIVPGTGLYNEKADKEKTIRKSLTTDEVKSAIDDKSGRIRQLLFEFATKQTSLIVDMSDPDNPKIKLPDGNINGLKHTNGLDVKYWTRRIDNLIGLLKLREKAYGDISLDSNAIKRMENHVANMTIDDMNDELDILGSIKSVVCNEKSKSEMIRKINDILSMQNLIDDPQNTYITFAVKTQSRISSSNRNKGYKIQDAIPINSTNNPGWPTRYAVSEEEKLIHVGGPKDDVQRLNLLKKGLVAIIGTTFTDANGNEIHQDILEFPVLNFTSPLTLMQAPDKNGNLYFKDLFNDYQALSKAKKNIHEIVTELIKKYGNDPYYQDIISMFKFFDFSSNGILFIKDKNFTIAKNLRNCAPQYASERGSLDLIADNYFNRDYKNRDLTIKWDESEWITVKELSEDPFSKVTDNIYISDNSKYELDDEHEIENLFVKGMPFVLVSFDKELTNDAAIIDYYARQNLKDSSVEKNVFLLYVLPPKASIEEYVDNLAKLFSKKNGDALGLTMTSYKILKRLIDSNDKSFKDLISNDERISKEIYDPNGNNGKGSGLLIDLLNKITEAYNRGKFEATKGIFYGQQDWSDYGIGKKGQDNYNVSLLDMTLLNITHPLIQDETTEEGKVLPFDQRYRDDTALKIIKNILGQEIKDDDGNVIEKPIDGVYYNIRTTKDQNAKKQTLGLDIAIGVSNYKLKTVSGKLLDFAVHGKVDPNARQDEIATGDRGFMISQIELFNDKEKRRPDESAYKKYLSEPDTKAGEAEKPKKQPKKNKNIKKPQIDEPNDDKSDEGNNDNKKDEFDVFFDNVKDKYYELTGEELTGVYNTKEELMSKIVSNINGNSESDYISLFFNDYLYAWPLKPENNISNAAFYVELNGERRKLSNLSDIKVGSDHVIADVTDKNGKEKTYDILLSLDDAKKTIINIIFVEQTKDLREQIISDIDEDPFGGTLSDIKKAIIQKLENKIDGALFKQEYFDDLSEQLNGVKSAEDLLELLEDDLGDIIGALGEIEQEDLNTEFQKQVVDNIKEFIENDSKNICEVPF